MDVETCVAHAPAKYDSNHSLFAALAVCIELFSPIPVNNAVPSEHATAWAGLLGLDLLIFALTLYKSITEIRYGGSTIMRVLLRDGSCFQLARVSLADE
jgi:hypothetical protein